MKNKPWLFQLNEKIIQELIHFTQNLIKTLMVNPTSKELNEDTVETIEKAINKQYKL